MTSRQTILAAFLRRKGEWVSTEDVIRAMESAECYGGYPPVPEGKSIHDSTARRMLSQDVQEINSDPDFDGIIVSGMNGYKLAGEEEALRYAISDKVEALRKLKRYYNLVRKAGQNNQADLYGEIRQIFAEV